MLAAVMLIRNYLFFYPDPNLLRVLDPDTEPFWLSKSSRPGSGSDPKYEVLLHSNDFKDLLVASKKNFFQIKFIFNIN
jgi:hypothetical protein